MNAEHQQTAEPSQTQDKDNGGCGCNLDEIGQLACKAKRFTKQSEVMNEHTGELDTFRQQYEDARKKYTDARDAASADIASVRSTLDDLWDKLRCRLTDDQKECMKDQVCKVFKDIEECSDPPGCHSPCDDSEGPDPETQTDIGALAAEIARRRNNLQDSTAYFTALVGEPDAIKQQAAKLKADADALAKDVDAGGDSSAVPSLYARWLIIDHSAKDDLSRLGRGFESVAAYLTCLCIVLKCLVSGWTTVAILEGRLAELQCQEDARQKACQKKKDDVLHAVLELYENCCRDKAGDTPDQAQPVTSQVPVTPQEPTEPQAPAEPEESAAS